MKELNKEQNRWALDSSRDVAGRGEESAAATSITTEVMLFVYILTG